MLYGYTPEEIWELAQRVVLYTHTDFPDTEIYICGTQRHRGEDKVKSEVKERYDNYIKEFVKNDPKYHYIDMFDEESISRDENFVADGLHFTPAGYEAYAEFFKRALKDELAKF